MLLHSINNKVQGPLYPLLYFLNFLTILILIDLPMYLGKISMELPILYFNGNTTGRTFLLSLHFCQLIERRVLFKCRILQIKVGALMVVLPL